MQLVNAGLSVEEMSFYVRRRVFTGCSRRP